MRQPDVIVPDNHPNPPEEHEVETAWALARHFGTVVTFLIPTDGYLISTQDMVMNGVIWELKSPVGSSRNTIGNLFRLLSKKRARNIVIDSRRTKLKDDAITDKIRNEIKHRRTMRRILFIGKDGTVIEINRQN